MENPNCSRSLWDLSNAIETISYKLSSIRDVAELIAERRIDAPESGATWAVSEMIEVQEKALEKISEELLNLHRENLPDSKAKGKKK